jgi:alpha-N-arabinofuranosidase
MRKTSPKVKFATVLVFVILLADAQFLKGQQKVSILINPSRVEGRIDEKVYGHFLEHIYHSVNGGLWGEMVWNRSFEELGPENAGMWSIKDEKIIQDSMATNVRLWFGQPEWADYEFTLQARKTGGSEGFLVLFRGISNDEFYWYNFGGWGNDHHALEKGTKGKRWGSVGPPFKGQIEADRWYDIKVRCKENHIQVWLDDKKVLDFTDTDKPHLRGRVGIGTWATTAEFKNIRVADPGGQTLFEGIPEAVPANLVSRHWEPFGKAKFDLTKENPLNSNFCQYIESNAGIAGIRQSNLNIVKGQTYSGSVWIKGRAQNGINVIFSDGENTIYQVNLPAPSSKWTEHKFQFDSDVTAHDASLSIQLQGKAKVHIDQVGLMSSAAGQTGGYRPDLLKAIADLRPPIIRWPGGCFASPYRWKDGIGPQHKRKVTPRPMWDDLDINSYGTDEFIRMCHGIGAEPLIVVNIGTRTWNGDVDPEEFLQDVLDWIEYCNGSENTTWGKVRAQNGHPKPYQVKYWEIDNETWHMGAEKYVEAVKKFAPAMRKKDPTIKLAACGSGGFNHRWNREIIDGCAELIDYLSIHHYENPNLYAKGPYRYESFINETAKLIKESKNPHLRIYCSEWNAQSTDWRTGLYAGGILNAFERCAPTFEIGGPALFLRHQSATAWDNAFINFDQYRWFPAPNYIVMKLWRHHFAPYRIAVKAESSPLNVVATKSGNGREIYLKAVNPSDADLEVELSIEENFELKKAGMQLVAPGSLRARNTLEKPDAVQPRIGRVELKGQKVRFALPRLSVAVVSMETRQP